ncbi:MAG: hypothetical protein ACLFOY_15100, partial [Desulfatibacillaceae bacterium]
MKKITAFLVIMLAALTAAPSAWARCTTAGCNTLIHLTDNTGINDVKWLDVDGDIHEPDALSKIEVQIDAATEREYGWIYIKDIVTDSTNNKWKVYTIDYDLFGPDYATVYDFKDSGPDGNGYWRSEEIEIENNEEPTLDITYKKIYSVTQNYQGISRSSATESEIFRGTALQLDAPGTNGIYTEGGKTYRCVGWVNGTGQVPSQVDDQYTYTISSVTQDSSITWVYEEAVAYTIETTVNINQTHPGFFPEEGSGYLSKGKQYTFYAPASVTENNTQYSCTGWKNATGSISSQAGATGNYNEVTITLEQDSDIRWVYEEAVSLTVSQDGLPPGSYSFDPGLGDTYYLDGTTVTMSAPAMVEVSGVDYVCTGWTGTGDIADSATGNYTTVTLDQSSTIEWQFGQAVPMEVTTDGMPEGFRPVDDFSPPPGTEAVILGTNLTPEAPYLIEDTINRCYYRLTGMRGAGLIPTQTQIDTDDTKEPGDVYTHGTTYTIDSASSLEWVYEKVARLDLFNTLSQWGKADFKVTWEGMGTLKDAVQGRAEYYPVNTAVDIRANLSIDDGTGAPLYSSISYYPAGLTGLTEQTDTATGKKTVSFAIQSNTEIYWLFTGATRVYLGEHVDPSGLDPATDWDWQSGIDITGGGAGDTVENSFYYDADNRKLYVTRPLAFTVDWGNGGEDDYYSLWPAADVQSIVTAPVDLEPPGSDHTFEELSFSECYTDEHGNFSAPANPNPDTPVFQSALPGRSVLRFADNNGDPVFFIVNTIALPATVDEENQDIGVPVPKPNEHNDPSDKSGWIYHENAYYDGIGEDAAFDRENRDGRIIPVNKSPNSPASDRNLVVVWYLQTPFFNNISWPNKPVRYICDWPATPAGTIYIASGNGTGPLPEDQYTGQVYSQAREDEPGFNPNEEHALILGSSLFALRNDLNTIGSRQTSEPYVLLKYQASGSDRWSYKVYRVEAEGGGYTFDYSVEVGQAVMPLTPMDLLPAQAESTVANGEDWHHRDHKGTHWAKAANGLSGASQSQITMHWYYPLQKGFYYPLKKSSGAPVDTGDPVPFLVGTDDHSDPPVDVVYRTEWPADAPVLNVGETLTDAKYGLPDLVNWGAGEIL